MRGGAVVARRAHNPKVIGSSPVPATKKRVFQKWKTLLFYPPVWNTHSQRKIRYSESALGIDQCIVSIRPVIQMIAKAEKRYE